MDVLPCSLARIYAVVAAQHIFLVPSFVPVMVVVNVKTLKQWPLKEGNSTKAMKMMMRLMNWMLKINKLKKRINSPVKGCFIFIS